MRLTRDEAFADDLVQDTLERALLKDGSFRGGTNLRAWLFTVMRNRFLDLSSAGFAPTKALELSDHDLEDEPRNPTDNQVLWEAIAELPRWYAVPLALQVGYGWSVAEIAEALGLNPSTVTTQLSRARALLAEEPTLRARLAE